jgi:hypothetical protein
MILDNMINFVFEKVQQGHILEVQNFMHRKNV